MLSSGKRLRGEALRFSEEEVALLRRAALQWVKQQELYQNEIANLKQQLRQLDEKHASSSTSPAPVNGNSIDQTKSDGTSVTPVAGANSGTRDPRRLFAAFAALQQDDGSDVDSGPGPPGQTFVELKGHPQQKLRSDVVDKKLTDINRAADKEAQQSELHFLQAYFQKDFKQLVVGTSRGATVRICLQREPTQIVGTLQIRSHVFVLSLH